MAESVDSRRGLLEHEEADEKHFTTREPRVNWLHIVGIAVFTICVLLSGFFGGWQTARHRDGPNSFPEARPRVKIGNVVKIFEQDARFMKPPPAHGAPEPIWDSMLPLGLGYVKNPDIPETENVSTISAMHQLHCLYTLRRIYYSSTSGETNLESFDNGVDRHSHVGHCFEYLRQAIMCSADSSLEPFETPEGGFPGMGFARQCRDYEGLKEWAKKWRIMDVEGFILGDKQHDVSLNG